MPFIVGPNGVKFEVSDEVAASLLVDGDEYEIVKPRGKAKPAEGDE